MSATSVMRVHQLLLADFDAKLKVNEQASTNWMRVVYGSVKSE